MQGKAKKYVYLTDVEAVDAAIAKAEGRATARTVYSFSLVDAAERAEKWLANCGVPKARWRGTTLVINGGQSLPGSYGFSAECSCAQISLATNGLRLEGVWRAKNTAAAKDVLNTPQFSNEELATWVRRHIWR